MSNALETLTAPSYLTALLAANPALAAINQEALSGSAKPMPPTIVADKGKFVMKVDGQETVITFPDSDANRAAGIVGMPVPVLQIVVLKPKPGREKAYYVEKYKPGQETQSPDCFSEDGIKPDPSSRLKQCDNCASCAQNVFGSGTNEKGEPTAGKACADRKVLAIFANGGVYRFAVPPASLSGKRPSGLGMSWDVYCNSLSNKNIPLPVVITTISFDQGDTDYKLNFNYNGMLSESQLPKIIAMMDTPEVKEIVSPRNAQTLLPAPATTETTSNVVDMAAEKAKKDEEAKKVAAAEKKRLAAEEKKKADAAKAAAAAPQDGLDLGLGGLNEATPAAAQQATAGASDDDLIADLGL